MSAQRPRTPRPAETTEHAASSQGSTARSGRGKRPHVPVAFGFGVATALLGAFLVAIPVFLAWLLDPKSSTSGNDVFGIGLDAWALAHHAHVNHQDVDVVMTPLVLTALCVLIARLGAMRAFPKERLSARDLQIIMGGFIGGYIVGAQVVGVLTALGPAQARWWSLILGPALVALLGVALVYRKVRGYSPEVAEVDARARTLAPLILRRAAAPALGAVRWYLLAGGLLFVALAAWHGGRVLAITQQLDAGLAGNILLVLAQLMFLINFAAFGGAWLAGADVHVGSATFGHGAMQTGTLPIVPVFGALPDTPGGSWTWLSVLVVLAVGVWLGIASARTTSRLSSLRIKVLISAVAAALASLIIAVLLWFAHAGVSTGLLTKAGAGPIAVLYTFVELLVAATASAAVWHWWANHRR